MSPAATDFQPLRYFFHYDFDAFRMEIAGNLAGRAARKAYESWRTARLSAGRRPLVVDITHITEADEEGRAVLRSWQEQNARIVASSWTFGAIASSVPSVPPPRLSPQRLLLRRLASRFSWPTAGNPASAEGARAASAGAKHSSAENAGFSIHGGTDSQLR